MRWAYGVDNDDDDVGGIDRVVLMGCQQRRFSRYACRYRLLVREQGWNEIAQSARQCMIRS